MTTIIFKVQDSEDGQHVECEARSSDVDDKVSLANIIATYLAENWVGIVTAARMSHHQRALREGQELAKEEQVQPVTRSVIELSGDTRDCPHAAPHRYCAECVQTPCPVGLGQKGSRRVN